MFKFRFTSFAWFVWLNEIVLFSKVQFLATTMFKFRFTPFAWFVWLNEIVLNSCKKTLHFAMKHTHLYKQLIINTLHNAYIFRKKTYCFEWQNNRIEKFKYRIVLFFRINIFHIKQKKAMVLQMKTIAFALLKCMCIYFTTTFRLFTR